MNLLLAADEDINPLVPTLSEIILVLVIFGIIWYAVAKFVVPNFEKTFKLRRNEIEGGIARAEQAQAEAQRMLEQYQQQLAEARTEAAQIREGARAEAQRIVEEITAQAREESARIVARGEEQLTTQRGQIVRELRAEIGSLAVELSEKILDQRLAEDANVRDTVDSFLRDLQNTEAASRGAGSPS